MKKIEIFPSLISGDLLNLDRTIKELEPYCAGFHIDVMDDHFVPNLSWGPQFVNALAAACQKPLFVHLMVMDPLRMMKRINVRPHSIIAFHVESKVNFPDIKNFLKEKKLFSCAAISPQTTIEKITPYLEVVDQVLVMSVFPGFSGQAFLPESFNRLDWLMHQRKKLDKKFIISIDGGINSENIAECVQHGATSFGIAAGIFNQNNPVAALRELYNIGENA